MNNALPDIQAEPMMLPVAERVRGVDEKGIVILEVLSRVGREEI